jgi:hypothetical protein
VPIPGLADRDPPRTDHIPPFKWTDPGAWSEVLRSWHALPRTSNAILCACNALRWQGRKLKSIAPDARYPRAQQRPDLTSELSHGPVAAHYFQLITIEVTGKGWPERKDVIGDTLKFGVLIQRVRIPVCVSFPRV